MVKWSQRSREHGVAFIWRSSGRADVVRDDTAGKETRYWLKHKGAMKGLLKMLERVVDISAKLK